VSRTILYLTPYPPERSGIADYACAYKTAVETRTDWRLVLAESRRPLVANAPPDWMAIYRRTEEWRSEGRLRSVALVHAEIGVKQHDEFWTLFWLQRLLPEVPCCVTVHDPPLVVAPALYPLAFGLSGAGIRRALRVLDYTRVGKMAVRSVLGRARDVFALSKAGTESLRGILGDRTRLQTLPFLAYGTAPPRPPKGADDGAAKILFLGFWGPGKGIEVLLEAVERALCRAPGSLQVVLGGGIEEGGANRHYVESARERIRKSTSREVIKVIGYVPAEGLDGLFAAADIFVLPSTRRAGLSTSSVLFRAMAAGLAIVASDVGAVREEIRHMETGLLVPPRDVVALTEALLLLAGDTALRMRLGQQAQVHLEAEHDGAIVAAAAARTYEALARA
jgi:glycosyltransferase involved in cell wall biosynthesis